MPKEVTATIMAGPIAADSNHGRPSGNPRGKLFCPSHVLTLMEGTRAAWIVQCFPALSRPCPTWRILPSSPEHLLAAALLGYTAFTVPTVINESATLRDTVWRDLNRRVLSVDVIDDALAAAVIAECVGHVYGLITALPGSTITDSELAAAQAAGLPVAAVATQSL